MTDVPNIIRRFVWPRKHENTKNTSAKKDFAIAWVRGVVMLPFVAALILSLACGTAPQTAKTPAPGSEMPRTVIDPYLKIHTALSDDSIEGVRAAAGEVATAASALGAPAMKIDTAAVQLASATELEGARTKFGVLSEAIEAYMNGLKLTPPAGVKMAFCPMVMKPWLQADATITNPYYGKDMLTCGNFK